MAAIIKSGRDIHTETGNLAGVPRQDAKTVNFGVIYGIGARSLAINLSKASKRARSEGEAQSILEKYHAAFPRFRWLLKMAERQAETHSYIKLWTGRLRHYGASTDPHKAMSNLIQGGVGEIMRVAMCALEEELQGQDAQQILQVHDDILFLARNEFVDEFIPKARDMMTNFCRFGDIPILADPKAGKSWGTLKAWSPSRLF